MPDDGKTDPKAWQAQQDHQQQRAAELHRQRIKRENEKRKDQMMTRTHSEILDGVKEIDAPPLDEIHVPARGPQVKNGRYVADGQVPTTKRKRAQSRVAEAREASGRVKAARKKAQRSVSDS